MFKKLFLLSTLLLFSFFSLARAESAESVDALLRHPGDPIAGNKRGEITVVEFYDFQCEHCMNMGPVIGEIIAANPNVRFVFKDVPAHGPLSDFASRAALAAQKQGKYYQFIHAMMASNQALSQENVVAVADSVGLNIRKLKNDMYKKSVTQQLRSNFETGRAINLSGTPAFYFARSDAKDSENINYVIGEMSKNDMQKAIDSVAKQPAQQAQPHETPQQ